MSLPRDWIFGIVTPDHVWTHSGTRLRRPGEARPTRHGEQVLGPALWGLARDHPGGGLSHGADDDLVDVHVRRPRDREDDAVGDVFGGQRLQAVIDRLGRLAVAVEPHEAELGLDQARVDLGHTDRLSI